MRVGKKASKRKAKAPPGAVLEVLRSLLAEGQTDAVVSLVSQLVDRNSELERRLAQVLAVGRKNEGTDTAQLLLFADQVKRGEAALPEGIVEANGKLRDAAGLAEKLKEAVDAAQTAEPAKPPPLRRPPPPHLPRVDNPIPVPADERPCPTCGGERECAGHDATEVIDFIPAKVVVRVDRREKLACKVCEGEMVRAPLGDKVVAGGRLGSALVAQLLVDKYVDGLPLHRQKERWARLGLDIAVSTLADQVTWATDLLRPLWRAAVCMTVAAEVMHLDGTSLPVLDRDAPGGKRLGALWGYVGVTGERIVAAYVFNSTAKKQGQKPGEMGPQDVLAMRQGYTVADASNLFDASFARPELIECGCNMHGRRYFVAALDAGDARAALPLGAYKKIYEHEAEIRERARDPDAILAERQAKSGPIWDQLVNWCTVMKPHEPPASPMGAALRYFTNHRAALGRFLESGVVPMDNGVVERLHVRAALTRKNFLFVGSDAGGERAAVVYTLAANCRLMGVDPVEYFRAVLPVLARRIRIRELTGLLPAPWKARRAAAAAYAGCGDDAAPSTPSN